MAKEFDRCLSRLQAGVRRWSENDRFAEWSNSQNFYY